MNVAQRKAISARQIELKSMIVKIEAQQNDLVKTLTDLDKVKAKLWQEYGDLQAPDRSIPEGVTLLAHAAVLEKDDLNITFDLTDQAGARAFYDLMRGGEDGDESSKDNGAGPDTA